MRPKMSTENINFYCKETCDIYKSYTNMIIKEIQIIKENHLDIFKKFTKEQEVDFIIDQLRSKEQIRSHLLSMSQTYENGIFFKTQIGQEKSTNFVTFLFHEDDSLNFSLSYIGIDFNHQNQLRILYETETDYFKFQITDQENGFKIIVLDSDKYNPVYLTVVPDKISDRVPNIEAYTPVHYHNKNKDLAYNNIFLQDKNKLNFNINIFSQELIDIHLMTYDYDLSKYSNISLDLKLLQTPYDIANNKLKKENKNAKQ